MMICFFWKIIITGLLMTILELLNYQLKKASSHNGGEYHGPCPKCGGTDRFHVWPAQGDHGSFWCRFCKIHGDAIQFLRDVEGMSCPEAHKALEIKCESTTCSAAGKCSQGSGTAPSSYATPQQKKPAANNWQPRQCDSSADTWRNHAEKLVDYAHQALLDNPEQLAWLAARGIDLAAVIKHRLGWLDKDHYRDRAAWGLPAVLRNDSKPKKLWLPAGLVIPCFSGGVLQRLRIRRPVVKDGEMRYYLVPGSATMPMVINPEASAFVIVESELDAILLDAVAGDLVGIISQGNSSAKPDNVSHAVLENAAAILVALDSDHAGAVASRWWLDRYSQAERHPVVGAKDPGDAYKAGIDLRVWILAGLPPGLAIETTDPVLVPVDPELAAPSTVHQVTTRDGRTINITDDIVVYRELAAAGKIVMNGAEIEAVRRSGADKDQAAIFIDIKEIFGGTICPVIPISDRAWMLEL